MKQCLTEHIWYSTPDFEIFGRSNFHVGQQIVTSEIASCVKNLMGAFMPCKTLCVSEAILGREANVIYCRVYFFP